MTISDTRTPETDTGGDIAEELLEGAGQEVVERRIVRDEVSGIRNNLIDLLANPEVDAVVTTGGTGISARDTTYEVVERMVEKRLDGFGEIFRMLSYEEIGSAAIMSRALAGAVGTKFVASLPGSRNAVRLAVEKLLVPELVARRVRASQAPGKQVEIWRGNPCHPEADALWRRLWEMWQDNDEEDVILDSDKLADLEDEIPGLENRMKTALAYLQRARYIQYRSGVGDDGIEPILYDVYEPR